MNIPITARSSSSNAADQADHPTLQLQNYHNCRLKLYASLIAIPNAPINIKLLGGGWA